MQIYDNKSSFGWDGDNGVGERLIQQIIDGVKTATCSFKVLYTDKELDELKNTKGSKVTVIDHKGQPRCNIEILDIFETTYGDPDIRLVRGEGDGDDIEQFKKDHQIAWDNTVKDVPLTDDAILMVELFRLIEVMEIH